MNIHTAEKYRKNIIDLLSAEKLPTDDLPSTLSDFRVVLNNGEVIGAIGLEFYNDYALLRSLVVLAAYRDKGIAGKLLQEAEGIAEKKIIKAIYLLTETAPAYFTRKGYETITRLEVPEAVRQSTEFTHVCPQSAIVMQKSLKKQ